MFERMLDRQNPPTAEAFLRHCGAAGSLLEKLDGYLSGQMQAQRLLRFPYGNSYGWGVKYSIGRKHICDVFAEAGAFTVMLRLTNEQVAQEYDGLTDDTKACVDSKYPCGDGGWIHCRVQTEPQLRDVVQLLARKIKK